MIYLLIVCIIIIGFLGYKLFTRQKIDNDALQVYTEQIATLQDSIDKKREAYSAWEGKLLDITIRCNTERNHLNAAQEQLSNCELQLKRAQASYDDLINRRMKEVNSNIDEQAAKRQEQLDETFQQKEELQKKLLEDMLKQYEADAEEAKTAAAQVIDELSKQVKLYQEAETFERERFESLRKPLMQYEMERQQRLFYTIQLPEEYRDDIEFLLTTVAAKVQHPDIISKLVWAEYVKPNLDNTFKRVEIKAEPGIYKLTNLDSGKAYIGKSTDVKKRIADHFKSSIGIRSIADQAVHHEILKTGFWNWTIEIITYCEKDRLSELEKYYIDFFKTQEFGFNKREGG